MNITPPRRPSPCRGPEQGRGARGAPPGAHAARRRGGARHLRGDDVAPVRRQVSAVAPTARRNGSWRSSWSGCTARSTRCGVTRRPRAAGSRAPISRWAPRRRSFWAASKGWSVSSRTWTPRAVASSARAARFALWRAVEAQHVVATMALVDTLDEQHHAGAPARCQQAAGARRAHRACTTSCSRRSATRRPRAARAFAGPTIPACSTAPTRYGPRARSSAIGAGGTCSTRRRCGDAVAAADGVSHAPRRADAVDLRETPFVRDRAAWTHPSDYGDMPALRRRRARGANVGAIRYESVRDPQHGGCCAVPDLARVRQARARWIGRRGRCR